MARGVAGARSRTCSGLRVALGLVVATTLASARPARADVDITASWDIDLVLSPPGWEVVSGMTVIQSGTSVSMQIGDTIATGTIDPASGAFSVLSPDTPACDQFGLQGVASPDGNTMTGTGFMEVQGPPIHPICVVFQLTFTANRVFCGNGVLDPGESCDDGNRRDGDCCSASCVAAAVGSSCADDGQGCTADVCDDGLTCTHHVAPAGTLCRVTTQGCNGDSQCDGTSPACLPLPDSDGDGIPDGCDLCPGGLRLTAPRLTLGRYDGISGNDKFVVQGELESSAAAALTDPVAHGLQIVVTSPEDRQVLFVPVPAGAYDRVTRTGWKVVGRSGQAWKFRSADTSARVRLSLDEGPRVDVKASGKRWDFATRLPITPLRLTLRLDPDPFGAMSTACGEIDFEGPGLPPPSCKSRGSTLDCR